MQYLRLLERVAQWEENDPDAASQDIQSLIDSIRIHIELILNTRQGSAPIDEQFGIPDFSNYPSNSERSMGHLFEDEISKVIARYEPRLSQVQVSYLAEDMGKLGLNFELTGQINVGDRDIPIHMHTTITPEGKSYVQS